MSCQHARLLVQHSAFRFIATCDCDGDIVHVSWDVATLHLCSRDFSTLAQVLQETALGTGQRYYLQIGTVVLILSTRDHVLLTELVATALARLNAPPPAKSQRPLAKVPN